MSFTPGSMDAPEDWVMTYSEPGPQVEVGVTVPVGVLVAVPVWDGPGVIVDVGVNVGSPQTGDLKVSCSPGEREFVLHEYWLKLPVPLLWTPIVAPVPPWSICPYTISNLSCPSNNRTSKLTVTPVQPLGLYKQVRHSTLKMRLGVTPTRDVKMPPPGWLVNRSSQCAMIALLNEAVGRQPLVNAVAEPAN